MRIPVNLYFERHKAEEVPEKKTLPPASLDRTTTLFRVNGKLEDDQTAVAQGPGGRTVRFTVIGPAQSCDKTDKIREKACCLPNCPVMKPIHRMTKHFISVVILSETCIYELSAGIASQVHEKTGARRLHNAWEPQDRSPLTW
jgi:hypothetical protein